MNKNNEILDLFRSSPEMIYKTMLTSSKRHKGTLKECLRHYDSTQLELINNVYDNEEFEDDLPKKDKIELLYQMIMRGVESNLKDLPVHFLEDLEYLLNNENYQVKNTELLGLGLVFLSIEGDQEKYYIPSDLRKEVKKQLNSDVITQALVDDCALFFIACHFVYGLVSRELFQKMFLKQHEMANVDEILDVLLDGTISLVKIDNKEYLWPLDYPVIEEAKRYVKDQKQLSYEKIIAYFFDYVRFVNIIMENAKDSDKLSLTTILSVLSLSEKSPDELIMSLSEKISLKRKQQKKIRKFLEQEIEIRYWSLGGLTHSEFELRYFILNEKPEDTTLNGCLSHLNKSALNILYREYQVSNIDNLFLSIINNMTIDAMGMLGSNLEYENQTVELAEIDASMIRKGLGFLYLDHGKVKFLIPDDFMNILLNDDLEEDDIDYLSLYMVLNGVILRKRLQKILKEYHNLDYTLSELDDKIQEQEFFVVGEYYSILEDISEEDKYLIISPKENNDYRIVNDSIFDILNKLDDFNFQLTVLLDRCNLNRKDQDDFGGFIRLLMHIGMFHEKMLKEFMGNFSFTMGKKEFKELVDLCNQYKNDIPLWNYNGFTRNELNEKHKKKKVGRNDLCPCGSGKKYKKCCGRNA